MPRVVGGFALALALLVFALLVLDRGLGSQFAIYDFGAYYFAAARLSHGAPLYPQLARPFALGELGLFLYPPPVAVAFIPFTGLPVETASILWAALLVAVAAVVLVALVRSLPAERRPFAAALLLLFAPLQLELGNGNLTLVTLALALAAWRWRSRALVSGGLLAAALLLKLMPALLLVFYARAGRWRAAAFAALLLALLPLATWPWLGAAWLDYARLALALASGPPTASDTHDMLPSALTAGAARAFLPGLALALAFFAAEVVRRDASRAGLAFALSLAAAPLLAPFVFYTYLVLALPLAARLCFGVAGPPRRALALAAFAVAAIPHPPSPSDALPLLALLVLLGLGVERLRLASSA